jgi:hypothetical protein
VLKIECCCKQLTTRSIQFAYRQTLIWISWVPVGTLLRCFPVSAVGTVGITCFVFELIDEAGPLALVDGRFFDCVISRSRSRTDAPRVSALTFLARYLPRAWLPAFGSRSWSHGLLLNKSVIVCSACAPQGRSHLRCRALAWSGELRQNSQPIPEADFHPAISQKLRPVLSPARSRVSSAHVLVM